MEQDYRNSYLAILITLSCFFGVGSPAKGQEAFALSENTDDPLKKPAVWNHLESRPTDSAAWANYYDKPLICLSASEAEQLKACRAELMKGLGEVVIEAKSDYVDWESAEENIEEEAHADISQEQEMLEMETNNYLARLKKTYVEESQEVKQLKANVTMNFYIIEELYAEEFRELGQEYTTYLSQYPDESYDKERWISEKEEELEKLKKKHFKKVKKQLMKNAEKHQQLSQTP